MKSRVYLFLNVVLLVAALVVSALIVAVMGAAS